MSWQQQRARVDARLAAFAGRDPGRRRALRLLTASVAFLFVLAAIVSLSTEEWGYAAAWAVVAAALLVGSRRYLAPPRRPAAPTPYPAAHARRPQERRPTHAR